MAQALWSEYFERPVARDRKPMTNFVKLFFGSVIMVVSVALPSTEDLERAARVAPRDHILGRSAKEIRSKINTALQRGPLRMQLATPCDEFSLLKLGRLQQTLFSVRSPELFTKDLRAPRHESAESLAAELKEEETIVQRHPGVEKALRDGRCAEIAFYWAHHLSEETRASFADTRLPLMSHRGSAEHGPQLIQGGHFDVVRRLTSQLTCVSGHDAFSEPRGEWEGFPAWPYEATYSATGYGQYPFWTGGDATEKIGTSGASIHTMWSAVVNAEKLTHAFCNLTFLDAGFDSNGPCTHLMLGTESSYLYNQEETNCCVSSTPQYVCNLAPINREFIKLFEYKGDIQDYVGESGYYHGSVKHYSVDMTTDGPFYFWYVTDPNGQPIEQGEGPCDMYNPIGDRYCGDGPLTMFHQYDVSTFRSTTLNPSVFAVPEICKSTTQTCYAVPTSLCEVDDEDDDDDEVVALSKTNTELEVDSRGNTLLDGARAKFYRRSS
uniref:Uncharacterized protein n=2 Tax=Noctiluca scintillans TaxID=2966 RepID=A0A7S1AMS2_NOCSC